jgi:hypothetical protein
MPQRDYGAQRPGNDVSLLARGMSRELRLDWPMWSSTMAAAVSALKRMN